MAFYHPGPGSASSSSSGHHLLNSPFGDTTYTKVFVGGLAWETKSETMRRYFVQYGEILEAVVITDKNTGRSKGYGFVTFRDPESAKKACANPSPVIDGRQANCNLAALGRPRPVPTFARPRSAGPYVGGVPAPRGTYVGGSAHHQLVPFGYQQGFSYPSYSYTTYGSEYVYPQSVYGPYMGQQYFQLYGIPGTVNTAIYPFGQLGQPIPGGHGYATVQGYTIPGHNFVQFSGPNVNGVTAAARPTIQAPYPAGVAAPILPPPRYLVTAHSPQFTQGSSSDQTAGGILRLQQDQEPQNCYVSRMHSCLASYHLCILEVFPSHHGHQRHQSSSCSDGWSQLVRARIAHLAAVKSVKFHALLEFVMTGGAWTDGYQNWIQQLGRMHHGLCRNWSPIIHMEYSVRSPWNQRDSVEFRSLHLVVQSHVCCGSWVDWSFIVVNNDLTDTHQWSVD